MGDFMDKWLPEMQAKAKQEPPESTLLSDEAGRKYKAEIKVCQDCKAEYESRTYHLLGAKFQMDRTGCCPACRKKRGDAFEADEKARIESEINNLREQWRMSCGIPKRNLHKSFEQFNKDWQAKGFKRSLEYAENFPIDHPTGYESLVLFSDHTWGTGKTHLACSIAHHILSRWKGEYPYCPVRFISEPVLFKSIRDTFNFTRDERAKYESEKEIIDSLIHVPLLILDDLGKEEVTDLKFVQRTLFAIFDGRYNEELPVVVTANLNDSGLKQHMGGNAGNEASFSRLYEMCKGEFIRMDGTSYREKLAKEK